MNQKEIFKQIKINLLYFACNILDNYSLNSNYDKNHLIMDLLEHENDLQELSEDNKNKTLAFRFGNSTGIYTINDLLCDLSKPTLRNYSYLLDQLNDAMNVGENSIEIIFN